MHVFQFNVTFYGHFEQRKFYITATTKQHINLDKINVRET